MRILPILLAGILSISISAAFEAPEVRGGVYYPGKEGVPSRRTGGGTR